MSAPARRASVVIPTYRRPADLRRCLAGLQAQVRRPDEVLLVVRKDDESTHGVLKEQVAATLPIRVVAPDQPGFVAALWTGLAHATGDFVALSDDDAVAAPDWLQRIEEALVRPGVVAAGGINRRIVDGVREEHRSADVGRLSWTGRMVGMHYADTGISGQAVEHLQGCNMAFARPWPLVDRSLGGDGVYNELDMCLRAGERGAIWYDERIAVDHYLGARQSDGPADGAGAAVRNGLSSDTVRSASWNYAYVLSKNTGSRPQRLVRAGYLLLVGQRPTWGLVAVVVWSLRSPERWSILRGLPAALAGKRAGWRAGAQARRRPTDERWSWVDDAPPPRP